jgi:hypothetical protein
LLQEANDTVIQKTIANATTQQCFRFLIARKHISTNPAVMGELTLD